MRKYAVVIVYKRSSCACSHTILSGLCVVNMAARVLRFFRLIWCKIFSDITLRSASHHSGQNMNVYNAFVVLVLVKCVRFVLN